MINAFFNAMKIFMDGVEARIGHDMTVFLCGAFSIVFFYLAVKVQIATSHVLGRRVR